MMLNKDGANPTSDDTVDKKKPMSGFYIPRALSKRHPLWLKSFNIVKRDETEEKYRRPKTHNAQLMPIFLYFV